jgi:hypothetical protein
MPNVIDCVDVAVDDLGQADPWGNVLRVYQPLDQPHRGK